MDPQRRAALQAEARKTRIQWIEDARRISPSDAESEARKSLGPTAEQLAGALPCALALHDFLGGLSGDMVEQRVVEPPAMKLSSILLPFALSEEDADAMAAAGRDDQPLPTQRPGRSTYDVLLDKLKHRLASEVVNNLEQFVFRFRERAGQLAAQDRTSSAPARQQHVAKIHAFLQRTARGMREHLLWRGETEAQWLETAAAVERLVNFKVYDAAFTMVADAPRDATIYLRLQSLSFVGFEHLDVAPLGNAPSPTSAGNTTASGTTHADLDWSAPRAELLRLDGLRSPGDKLACVLAVFDGAAEVLARAGGGMRQPGADDLLPALIYLVKSTNPPRLYSNLEYVQTFSAPETLISGRASYALTQLASALHFLESADASALSLEPEEYERRLGESQRAATQDMKKHQEQAAAAAAKRARDADSVGSGDEGEALQRLRLEDEEAVSPVRAPPPLSASRVSAMRRSTWRLVRGGGGGAGGAPASVAPAGGSSGGQEALLADSVGSGALALRVAANFGGAATLRAGLRFADVQAEELRMGDLPALVGEYAQLLQLCESLLAQKAAQAHKQAHRHQRSTSAAGVPL